MAIEKVGLVGLGFLGRSIAACLLSRGFHLIVYNKDRGLYAQARSHIEREIGELVERANFPPALLETWKQRYVEAKDVADLADRQFVIESVTENVQVKQGLIDELESVIGADVAIGSNTSAIPISILQGRAKHPQRIVGMHWSEPAHNTRFMELIRGGRTSEDALAKALEVGRRCGKEPSILHHDIRGFITNRLMYAMMREALHLLENGYADVESIDRSFRNDIGWWATIAGPFRLMDLTGLPAYVAVMKDLFPELANTAELPGTMKRLETEGANGVFNGRGFYKYTVEEAAAWQKTWADFSWDIRQLADKHTPLTPPTGD